MPSGRNALHYGGIPLSSGVFAVVESSEIMVDQAEVTKSDLLMPISKELRFMLTNLWVDKPFILPIQRLLRVLVALFQTLVVHQTDILLFCPGMNGKVSLFSG